LSLRSKEDSQPQNLGVHSMAKQKQSLKLLKMIQAEKLLGVE